MYNSFKPPGDEGARAGSRYQRKEVKMADPHQDEYVTPAHPADHYVSDHPVPAASPFTAAELNELQQDDIAAARAVVALMLSIFSLGVFIYSIVAYWVVNYS
jgi:hypothetical protein